jgi:hypothetical protein
MNICEGTPWAWHDMDDETRNQYFPILKRAATDARNRTIIHLACELQLEYA